MWRPIDDAPKDGSLILLLSISQPPTVALGKWFAEGTSWVDENGMMSGEAYALLRSGVWESGSGWFQPNEVTHWAPIPAVPET